ncbi:hypothetical protein [Pseudoclavibacter helvolus]|uniref:hypothetical protein n=1 Tax=Pseudoclavibacter helvolus TaxID=255205 RepID=UPI003C729E3C
MSGPGAAGLETSAVGWGLGSGATSVDGRSGSGLTEGATGASGVGVTAVDVGAGVESSGQGEFPSEGASELGGGATGFAVAGASGAASNAHATTATMTDCFSADRILNSFRRAGRTARREPTMAPT